MKAIPIHNEIIVNRTSTNAASTPHRRGRYATALLMLLLLAGQWQVSWHTMFHLADPVIAFSHDTDGAGAPAGGHGHSNGHCDNFTPAQLALPTPDSALVSAPPVLRWHSIATSHRHNSASLSAYQPRAPPLSA